MYVHNPRTHDERGPYFPYGNWDLTAADEIVVSAAREEYRLEFYDLEGALLEEVRVTGDCDLEYDRLRILPDGRAIVMRNFETTFRASLNMLGEDEKVREDSMFEVIVCDLVEVE